MGKKVENSLRKFRFSGMNSNWSCIHFLVFGISVCTTTTITAVRMEYLKLVGCFFFFFESSLGNDDSTQYEGNNICIDCVTVRVHVRVCISANTELYDENLKIWYVYALVSMSWIRFFFIFILDNVWLFLFFFFFSILSLVCVLWRLTFSLVVMGLDSHSTLHFNVHRRIVDDTGVYLTMFTKAEMTMKRI